MCNRSGGSGCRPNIAAASSLRTRPHYATRSVVLRVLGGSRSVQRSQDLGRHSSRPRGRPLTIAFAIWGWSCQGAGVSAPVLVGRLERLVWSGVSGRRGVRVGATLGQPHMRDRGGLRTLVCRSVRCLKSSRPGGRAHKRKRGRSCVRECPDPARRLDTPDVMSQCYAVAISQQAPTSSRSIAMVTTPAGLPRPMRSRFQRACRRRCTRQA